MTVSPLPIVRRERSAVAAIARAALTVALLDGTWAVMLWTVVLRRVPPGRVFQGVASAVIGVPAAREGGGATVALGLALHLCVATAWSSLYYALLRGWPRFRAAAASNTLPMGIAYGALVWIVMDLVIVPLTLARATPAMTTMFLVNLAGHMVVVGPPIALLMRREAAG